MNARPHPAADLPAIPGFLEKKEPDAEFAWWSTGRLLIVKDGTQISLSTDDLRALRRFFDQFGGGD